MAEKKIAKVSEKKKKNLAELVSLLNKSNTVIIASTRGLPSNKLQKLRKDIKDVKIVVIKKNLMLKALEEAKKEKLKELSGHLVENFAVIFSETDSYDVAAVLAKKKSKAYAKAGQIAPFDIIAQAGPTDLSPMFISNLADMGIKTKMEGGKVTIKEAFTLAKQGEKINTAKADIMMKLEIEPFTVSLEPVAAYDSRENTVYTELKVDSQGALDKMIKAMQEALGLSIHIAFATKETIKQILARASAHANALQSKAGVKQ